MCQINEFFMENFKDIANVIFWLFTGILAFLTYNNAKKTLFNPIRSETVKYQMKIITEFIDKHAKDINSMDIGIDYSSMIKLNFDTNYILKILNNEIMFNSTSDYEDQEHILNYCKEVLGGAFEIRDDENEKIMIEKTIGDFDHVKKYIQTELVKTKEEEFSHIQPQRLYLSKKFISFYDDLNSLINDPFLPIELKSNLEPFLVNININLGEIHKLLYKYLNPTEEIKYQIVYNEFYSLKKDHKIDIKLFRESITEFFKVNK